MNPKTCLRLVIGYRALVISIFFIVLSFSSLVVSSEVSAAEMVYFIHPDHLDSTNMVTNKNGDVVSQQVYYPYGNTKSFDGLHITDREYTGQVSDMDETGLYYYNARYYNPLIAKFTQADSINDQLNRYAYVANNPIRFNDPSGNRLESEYDYDSFKNKSYSASGYSHSVFRDFQHEFWSFVNSDHTNWSNYSTSEKIGIMSTYVHENIPYSPGLINIWNEMDNMGGNINYLNSYSKGSFGRQFFKSEIEELKKQNKQLINKEGDIWEYKLSLSEHQQYENNLFVCYNYADLLSHIVSQNLPEVEFYAAGVGGYSGGHAFGMFIDDDRIMKVVDPTWNWRPIDLSSYISHNYDYFYWSELGYNPVMSSPKQNSHNFYSYVRGALNYVDSVKNSRTNSY